MRTINSPNKRKLFDLPFFRLSNGNFENLTGLISKKLILPFRKLSTAISSAPDNAEGQVTPFIAALSPYLKQG